MSFSPSHLPLNISLARLNERPFPLPKPSRLVPESKQQISTVKCKDFVSPADRGVKPENTHVSFRRDFDKKVLFAVCLT